MATFQDATRVLKQRQRLDKMRGRIAPNWAGGIENPHTPINSQMLSNMPAGSRVEISPDVYEIMTLINQKTVADGVEIPFLLYGKTVGNYVYFDHIDADVTNLGGTVARMDNLVPKLQQFVNTHPHDGSHIVAHGHTHPKTASWYHNFSVDDLHAYADMRNDNAVFRDGKIELCSVLLVDGQYNFLFFDPNANDYFRFGDVSVRGGQKLPCYGGAACVGMAYGRGGRG